MTNLEFIENQNNKTYYSTVKNEWIKFIPMDFQKRYLSMLDNNKLIACLASRQMGITTILAYHLSNWIVNNKHNKKKFIIISNNSLCGKNILERIRLILHNKEVTFIVNNKNKIQLSNGNYIKIISKYIDLYSHDDVYGICVDNAGFIDLKPIIEFGCRLNCEQLIIQSSLNKNYNYFYDNIFTDKNNWTKIKLHWSENNNLHSNKLYNDNLNLYEIDLERPILKKLNKDKIISIRLSEELLFNISYKLIEKNINISSYIRELIEKDNII